MINKESKRNIDLQKYLRVIASYLPGLFYWKDVEGHYLGCSESVLKTLGYTSYDELLGKTDYDLWPNQAPQLRENDLNVMRTKKSLYVEEMVHYSKEDRYYIVIKSPLLDKNGEVVGIIGNSIPITEVKQKNELTTRYLNRVLTSIPGNIYLKNTDGVFLNCNEFMVKTAGLSGVHDIIGKTDYQLWPDQADAFRVVDQQVMRTGQEVKLEETVNLPNNERKTFSTIKAPLKNDNNEIIGIVGTAIDITELKRTQSALREALEQSEAASRAKSEFIQNMSHDIRSPLASMLGMSQLLETLTVDPTQKESEQIHQYAEIIHQSTERVLDLLNSILDLASAGQITENQLKQEPVSLGGIAQGLKELLLPLIHTKNLTFNIDIDPKVPKTITGDRNKIERILLNLLNNAIKFTDHGHVTLKIHVLELKKERVQLQIQVIDTGIGIPEDKLHQVFEEFFRVHPSYEGIYKGHGVGLFIVKKFIALMHGEVTVK